MPDLGLCFGKWRQSAYLLSFEEEVMRIFHYFSDDEVMQIFPVVFSQTEPALQRKLVSCYLRLACGTMILAMLVFSLFVCAEAKTVREEM